MKKHKHTWIKDLHCEYCQAISEWCNECGATVIKNKKGDIIDKFKL